MIGQQTSRMDKRRQKSGGCGCFSRQNNDGWQVRRFLRSRRDVRISSNFTTNVLNCHLLRGKNRKLKLFQIGVLITPNWSAFGKLLVKKTGEITNYPILPKQLGITEERRERIKNSRLPSLSPKGNPNYYLPPSKPSIHSLTNNLRPPQSAANRIAWLSSCEANRSRYRRSRRKLLRPVPPPPRRRPITRTPTEITAMSVTPRSQLGASPWTASSRSVVPWWATPFRGPLSLRPPRLPLNRRPIFQTLANRSPPLRSALQFLYACGL